MKAIDTSWRKQQKNLNTKLPSHFNTEYIFYRKGNILFQSTRNMKLLHYSFILIDERWFSSHVTKFDSKLLPVNRDTMYSPLSTIVKPERLDLHGNFHLNTTLS